jgi:hypothetical protein
MLKVQGGFFNAARNISVGGQMENQVNPRMQSFGQFVRVSYIQLDKFEPGRGAMMLEKIKAAPAQIVQGRHGMSAAHQAIDKIGANKAGASGHDDVHRPRSLPMILLCASRGDRRHGIDDASNRVIEQFLGSA